MKINYYLLAVTALIAVSCSPKALIKDRSGSTISVKKFKSSDTPLVIRFAGGRMDCSFKSLSSFTINPSIREIYEGQTWIQIEYSFKKDKTSAVSKGWIPQLSQVKATTLSGPCELDLVNLSEVDFTMGKKSSTPAPSATDTTNGTTNVSDSAEVSTGN